MNSDVLARLLETARGAVDDLGPLASDMDRLAARNRLRDVLAEVELDADFRRHTAPAFDGEVYDPAVDDGRLRNQLERVFDAMRGGPWRTLGEISEATGEPPASVSAQLRHLRKPRFGSYLVEKRPRGEREAGLFEYRVLSPTGYPIVGAR